MIKKYSDFIKENLEFILESNVVFSDNFRKAMTKIEHPMAKAIEKIKKNYNADHDFDIQVNPDMEFHDIIYNNEINGQTYMSIYTGNKNAVKIGKFIKKVLPTTTDAQIEEFVNELKAVQDNLKEKIELVSGDEIAKWYKSENCYSGGSLGSSCMVDKNFFDIYTQNPESVNLLIMKSGDKIISRALVWKIKTTKPQLGFTYYMDIVYTKKDHQEKVMIAFAEKQGYSKFGSYTGNQSTDGPFLYFGFKPAFLMVKKTSSAENWFLIDNKRHPINDGQIPRVIPNNNDAESEDASIAGDFLSNGFKIRATQNMINESGTYIYLAFAESPFVSSEGVPTTAR